MLRIGVDVGGTTTDIGVLRGGFPHESSISAMIAGVRTNFRMPDVLSIGLGGGSEVRFSEDKCVTIGPQSVGHELHRRARIFDGDTLTVTDIAVAAGRLELGDKAALECLMSRSKPKLTLVLATSRPSSHIRKSTRIYTAP